MEAYPQPQEIPNPSVGEYEHFLELQNGEMTKWHYR